MVKDNEGSIKSFLPEKIHTVNVKGTNARIEYLLVYKVIREKGTTTEKITLIKKDGSLKILGYDVK